MFHMYSIIVQLLYTLQSDHHHKSSHHTVDFLQLFSSSQLPSLIMATKLISVSMRYYLVCFSPVLFILVLLLDLTYSKIYGVCLSLFNLLHLACVCWPLSYVQLYGTPWTITHQTSLSIGFSRHEYWSGLPCPSSEDLPDPGIEPRFPALQALYHLSHKGSLSIIPSSSFHVLTNGRVSFFLMAE